jgi:hypothetical protein
MDINITLKDTEMSSAFVKALEDIGYSRNSIKTINNNNKTSTVSFTLGTPKTV